MLISLHVKDFAIINEIEVNFKEHLNIMTGETGAGKSIIIGSINAALGAKVGREIVRTGAEYALVELVFESKNEAVFQRMTELDIPIEGDQIIITRRILSGRSICKINGESVTASILSEIAGLLIDIHGQHEHQSLLHKSKHLEIVDRFAKEEIGDLKTQLKKSYQEYHQLKLEYEASGIEEEQRLREISFLEYEINEIKNANLKFGEDDELEMNYKKLSNANTIKENMQDVYQLMNYDASAAGDAIGRALRQLHKIAEFDEALQSYLSQLSDIDGLVNDFNRDLSQYLSNIDNTDEELDRVTKRLDLINLLKSKYGNSTEQILEYCNNCEERLLKYRDYDIYREELLQSLVRAEGKVQDLSKKLSAIRRKMAVILTDKITKALVALNFLDVRFEMVFEQITHYSANGYDEAWFIISTNPGESMKPLSKVASGGELSRIMLGIKSVLADKDEIETLIFDEIDVGISGRTAQKVSEQLSLIAESHQIISITHLAQIAAMADTHFIIDKTTDGTSTETIIKELNEIEIIEELSRILGGAEITDRLKESAKEMKELALATKKYKL